MARSVELAPATRTSSASSSGVAEEEEAAPVRRGLRFLEPDEEQIARIARYVEERVPG